MKLSPNNNSYNDGYLYKIWDARYFWLHLAKAELKFKFRGSKLGLVWVTINPLVLTLMMSFIFSNLFDFPMENYAPYVFSGLIIWEFLINTVMGGSNSLIVSEAYIKQFKHPLVIYPLKTNIVNIISFLIAMVGLLVWIAVIFPGNLISALPIIITSTVSLFILAWPIAILCAFTNIKYRDFGQVMGLVMQLIWYMSPVFFEARMFKAVNLSNLIEYNPVTHVLNLFRAPLLYGRSPTSTDYLFVGGLALILYVFAYIRVRTSEKQLIFYF